MKRVAVILEGNEFRFRLHATEMADYLKSCDFTEIIIIPYRFRNKLETKIEIYYAISNHKNADILFFIYIGHGINGWMTINDHGSGAVEYSFLAKVLAGLEIPTITLISSCYAGSAIPFFVDAGIIPDHGLLICSSAAVETSYSYPFLELFIKNLKRRGFSRDYVHKDEGNSQHSIKIGQINLEKLLWPSLMQSWKMRLMDLLSKRKTPW